MQKLSQIAKKITLPALIISPIAAAAIAAGTASIPAYNAGTAYTKAGSHVTYSETVNGKTKTATFVNSWWTQGEQPRFYPNSGPWKMVGSATITDLATGASQAEATPDWNINAAYSGGSVVKQGSKCYKAKYWTQGFDPTTLVSQAWETPWEVLGACPEGGAVDAGGTPVVDPVTPVTPDTGNTGGGGGGASSGDIDKIPADSGASGALPDNTPVVPPVTPTEPKVVEPTVPAPDVSNDGTLPADGYAFLRQVTDAQWDWLFPLRSGKYNTAGGTRNTDPGVARKDGSTDVFTLKNFRKAVLEYNNWAKANGYKQFLNEGTPKQQAQEFIAFWAKSARETSGSWTNAPSPWIVDYTAANGEKTKVWKGGLYWVEEVGYTTAADGTSAAINYVDTGSADYPPVAGRSYYGRGIIQLSWNYNYGAFSSWLHKNGMMKSLITSRDTLLQRPDYVASNGELSILSGIWFWMTPQGAKPSSHDVLYGDVTNISKSSNDQGLPQLRAGFTIQGKNVGPTQAGDTTNKSVMAFRLGTVINIVNGGLECNGASSWHGGPPQRAAYYNAFAMYFNDQMPGLNVTRVKAATDLWDAKISTSSPEDAQSATCFNQKSYYGW